MSQVDSVQCFGRKKTATAVAYCKRGQGHIRVNGAPLELVQPAILREKVRMRDMLFCFRGRFVAINPFLCQRHSDLSFAVPFGKSGRVSTQC